MRVCFVPAWLALALACSTATLVQPTTAIAQTDNNPGDDQAAQPDDAAAAAPAAAVDIQGLLDAHNGFRARHGAAALSWSPALAAAAQAWANACNFDHDPNSGSGENLFSGGGGASTAVGNWYGEIANYDFNNPGFSMSTGHFTQVVWKGSQQLGCGVASCPNIPGGTFYVCRYLPAGNMQGAFPDNVTPANN